MELSGRTAFITGGAQGIGLGIARAAADKGMKLALVDIDEAALAEAEVELSKQTSVYTARLDVRDRAAYAGVADAVESELGPVSLLCNNAGVSGQMPVTHLTYEAWDWVMGINLNGVYNGIHTFLPRMLARGGDAHIFNTASLAGLLGNPGFLYASSKYAVVGMSESLRIELAPHNIGVSVLCPSAVATNIIDNTLGGSPTAADGRSVSEGLDEFFAFFRPQLAKGTPPDEVGRMVVAAVERNQQFVLTDSIATPYLKRRTDEIIEAMPA